MDDTTQCVHQPVVSRDGFAGLNVGTHRASTIVFDDGGAYASRKERGPDGYSYGLAGTPTSRTLEAQIAALEGALRTVATPSGLSAATISMLSILRPGDAVLIPDTVYPPVRTFALGHLSTFGIVPIFYDPLAGAEIKSLIDERTTLVWVESPGSTTMEVQDLPAIVAAAHARGALVGCDNSWATPLLFKPLAHGADLSIEAVTKYIGGHSDLLMGSISVRDPSLLERIRKTIGHLGIGVSPDDCSLALRGIQTLAVRLKHCGEAAFQLARTLAARHEVACVLHPALPECPGHEIWKRDFAGASGVFSVVLKPNFSAQVWQALDALRVFKIGASWGGTHSLIAPMPVRSSRTATAWDGAEPVLRVSIGLESPSDLLTDVHRFFDALASGAHTHVGRVAERDIDLKGSSRNKRGDHD